jgi:hypothetical protein
MTTKRPAAFLLSSCVAMTLGQEMTEQIRYVIVPSICAVPHAPQPDDAPYAPSPVPFRPAVRVVSGVASAQPTLLEWPLRRM